MSTYYEYQDVGVMIAHKLMSMDGWKVYGYHADESDSMTDYYSPAYWNGVAEKNGYILCVNVYGAAKEQEIRKYNYSNFSYNKDIQEKITKLEQMTVERGASKQEEESAKNMIIKLQKKAETEQENNSKYIVVGTIPAHQAHPPKCNWHIEKDGIIIAKGNGILKYSEVDNYYKYDSYKKDMNDFRKKSKAEYIKEYVTDYQRRYNESDVEKITKWAESHYNDMLKKSNLMKQFEEFINKIDTTCGGILGTGDLVTYEKVIVTEYKTENKAVETTIGSIKEGQCFIVKTSFNYGHNKGYVYRIHETEYNGRKSFHAVKLNGKLTKECTGTANQSNYWYLTENFIRWFEKGSLAWCNIEEVKTPYEVEKVVKKVIKSESKQENKTASSKPEQTTTTDTNNLTYNIKEDTDTRDNSKIYVVKVVEKLDREEYITINNNMKRLGGYYSKFKHGFIFKDDPTELLSGNKQPEEKTTEAQETADTITDYSTEIIDELKLNHSEYATNSEYINKLSAKISHLNITEKVINCLEYDGLKQAIKSILQAKQQEQPQEIQPQPEQKKSIDFEIEQSKHTKTNEIIWLVKIKSNLSKDDFAEVKRNFATIKGFYSGLYGSFIFKYDPTEKLQTSA
ncbi:hypothetical protein KQI61_15580 [Anaerocolumna aminovalerica]|uniref:hypothetical protein n=1 Tax=Anaerocolumna aminovalerica TaxID=1527 RepID=UPI001C0EE83E|nr:hypothetical protein [Anaerocolumna aminovalerica]MBU5333620.1 hypothetical protein [Anaerocolumna aminovalerica]